jgi:hypothetical protein
MRIARHESRPIVVRSAVLTALLAATLLAIAQPAHASIGEKILLRCTHQESLSGFSQQAYREALQEINGDAIEYSNCAAQIRQAQLEAAAGKQSATGPAAQTASSAAIAPTPSQRRAITHAEHAGSEPVKLDGRVIHPGVVHVDVASALSSLPTPLLAILTFLIVCALALAGGTLRKRFRAGRPD